MKTTFLSLLFISLFVLSCKKDEVAPDFSKNFTGVYRSIVNPNATKQYESKLTISRINPTKVSMNLIDIIKSYDSNKKLIDTETYSSDFKDVLLADESSFEINEIVTRTRQTPVEAKKYQMTGGGVLTGKSLSMVLKYDGQTGLLVLVKD